MRYLIVCFFALLAGCSSAPYRDDYANHINRVEQSFSADTEIQLSLADAKFPEIRGYYNADDTADASPMLYQGVAGIGGVIAQIGIHAAMIDSSRDNKLAEAQAQADARIQPLITLAEQFVLSDLLGKYRRSLSLHEEASPVVNLKPLFFSNEEMNRIELKLIAYIKKDKGSEKHLYQNMVHIPGIPLPAVNFNAATASEVEALKETLASTLQAAVQVIENDLRGAYRHIGSESETFLINSDGKAKAIRGKLVAQTCSTVVIKDLRSWYYVVQKEQDPNVKHHSITARVNDCESNQA